MFDITFCSFSFIGLKLADDYVLQTFTILNVKIHLEINVRKIRLNSKF